MVDEENNLFCVFTVCNIAYLPRALVLADSVVKHSGQVLKVVIFDKKRELPDFLDKIEIIWLEDLNVPRVLELAFMYDIIEFSTCLKPFIALGLFERYRKVIFLDPDTKMFSSISPILDDLDECSVLLTPHYTKPQPDTDSESDLAMMRFGSFNMGFFGIKNNEEGCSFLEWWHKRCVDFCFMESQFGLSTDQKWISIAPCLFRDIKVSFNLGYNAAPWNTFERVLSKAHLDEYYLNKKHQLVFFHFSNFRHNDPQYLNKRASSEKGVEYPILLEIGLKYSAELKAKSKLVELTPYTYDYMSDDTYISPTLRRAYSAVRMELPIGHDPFDSDGAVGRFAKKNYLKGKVKQGYVYPGLKDAERNSTILAVIFFVMRLFLRAFGPNRFYDLSKLMVYLSSYRRTRKLWKL